MKLLMNLFRVEAAKSNKSFASVKCGRKSTNSDCLSSMTVQEALSQVLSTSPLPTTPKVYLTTRAPTVELCERSDSMSKYRTDRLVAKMSIVTSSVR
ncbi:hypothetical protein AHF37_11557 [Paragonimus kellicotti]|nr:hypothetical protein AHF37_11557 [Paragonimus kellicotti]